MRRTDRKQVGRDLAGRYFDVGRALKSAMEALDTLADGEEGFGNAIGVLAVHAAIAYTDALTIAYGGFKSTSGDHTNAAAGLRDALHGNADESMIRRLDAVLRAKDTVSYQGRFYRLDQARVLLEDAVEFCRWAEMRYAQRPPAHR